VRETDQTTLCPDCFRRKINEITKEFTEAADSGEETRPAAAPSIATDKAVEQGEEKGSLVAEDAPAATARAATPEAKTGRFGRKDKTGRKTVSEPPAPPSEDFLSQGPDDDFSQLGADSARQGRWSLRPKKAAAVPATEAEETVQAAETAAESARADVKAEIPPAAEAEPAAREAPIAEARGLSEDSLLQDVMSTLLKPEAGGAERLPAAAPGTQVAATTGREAPAKERDRRGEAKARAREAKALKKEAKAREKEAEPPKEKDVERWSFLAQPRSSEYTLIAVSWWRATIFIALMLLLGAVLWAVPNAYLIPKDQEYGIHAVAIGVIIGLAFWWKAGKKHSTKLAVQAALTTLFALFIGEFLHWFLIITKYDAFRTIFFDLISFKFLWENGADILRYTVEAMFPIAFVWLLLLPTVTAFIIGFGMPPIPEIFFQIWHAIKGQTPEEKEASHGLEG
jgi:hypothetical protein